MMNNDPNKPCTEGNADLIAKCEALIDDLGRRQQSDDHHDYVSLNLVSDSLSINPSVLVHWGNEDYECSLFEVYYRLRNATKRN